MWMTQDDARSDFILAAAPPLLRDIVVDVLERALGGITRTGVVAIVLAFTFTGLAPLLLARHRRQGLAAFGLDEGRAGLGAAAPMLAVFVGASLLYSLRDGASVFSGLLGQLAVVTANPVVGGSLSLFQRVEVLVLIAVQAIGTLLLLTFLTTRARHAFREVDMSRTEAVRTYGMASAAAVLLMGLLITLGGTDPVFAIVPGVGLGVLVLLLDRLVQAGATSSRWAMLAPGLVLVFLEVGLFGLLLNPVRGIFDGGFVLGLGVLVAVAVETRRHAWAAVVLVLGNAVWALERVGF